MTPSLPAFSSCRSGKFSPNMVVFILLIGGLYGCGKSDLSRAVAEKQIQNSDVILQLASNVPLQPNVLQKGAEQGAWRLIQNGGVDQGSLGEKASQTIASVNYNSVVLRKATKVDVKVTGVAGVPMAENVKEAQFTWGYVELPSLVKRYALQGGTGSATFRLFDDGWRLERVNTQVSNTPVTLSPKEVEEESADTQAEAERRKLAIENQVKHIQESRTPKKVIETFSFPTFTNLGNKLWEKPITQEIILTDVDVEFIENNNGRKMKLWFGNIWNIGEVGNSTSVAIAAYSSENPWIPIDTDQRRKQFMTALKLAIESWRANFGDVRHD